MSDLDLVRGNDATFVFDLTDDSTGSVFDVSSNDLSVDFRVRRKGRTETTNVACTKLIGLTLEDGTVNTGAPYNVAGVGGRCQAACAASVFPNAGEYEAEIRVTNALTSAVMTVFQIFAITVRHPF